MGGCSGGCVSNRRNNQQGAPQELGLPHEITLAQLDQYPPEQQKLLLGERLYPMIQKTQAALAGKITGMLLDSGWSIEVLFSLLGDEEKLNQKIDEAVGVLKRAQQQQEVDGTDEYQDQPGDDGENH
jgi:polyadenylate-binding protein